MVDFAQHKYALSWWLTHALLQFPMRTWYGLIPNSTKTGLLFKMIKKWFYTFCPVKMFWRVIKSCLNMSKWSFALFHNCWQNMAQLLHPRDKKQWACISQSAWKVVEIIPSNGKVSLFSYTCLIIYFDYLERGKL